MIDMYSKYDNMHKNGMFYALICINNHIIISINCQCMACKGANHLSAMHAQEAYHMACVWGSSGLHGNHSCSESLGSQDIGLCVTCPSKFKGRSPFSIKNYSTFAPCRTKKGSRTK